MRIRRTPSTVSGARRAFAIAAGVLGLGVGQHAAAQQTQSGVELEPHALLEDPFNHSFVLNELETHDGDLAWDGRLWLGYDANRLTLRTEGERTDGSTERAELSALWTHAVARWWDVVAGARADFAPGPSRTWAAFGVQGLAPYRFELEATVFVADGGDSAARFEAEYELLITQRLVLQPQMQLDWYGQTDGARGVGAGLSSAELALRLRYEVRREVAPYVGLVRERKYGRTADLARSVAADPDDTRLVLGVRLRL